MNNTPISSWGYFGYRILFGLPLIGWVVALVLAISAPNVNVRNFARSQFIALLFIIPIAILFFVLGLSLPEIFEEIEYVPLMYSPSLTQVAVPTSLITSLRVALCISRCISEALSSVAMPMSCRQLSRVHIP